jgi:hypothetical protein
MQWRFRIFSIFTILVPVVPLGRDCLIFRRQVRKLAPTPPLGVHFHGHYENTGRK